MARATKLVSRRRLLLDTCEEIRKTFGDGENHLKLGVSVSNLTSAYTSEGAAIGSDASNSRILDSAPSEPILRFRAACHAALILEWHDYLDDVYGIAVDRCLLKDRSLSRFDKASVDLKLRNLSADSAGALRGSIVREARRAHSFVAYNDKVDNLKRIFPCAGKEALRTLRTHTAIRNTFQHSRGMIRDMDLKELGMAGGSPLTLKGDDGQPREFRKGKQIELSKYDIRDLIQAMKDCSEAYKELP